MKRWGLVAAMAALGCAVVAVADTVPLKITVETMKQGPEISKSLYGIFFEEINHAGDGGLYAELVRNRSFEDATPTEGWSPYSPGPGTATMEIVRNAIPGSACPTALRVAADGGPAGIANAGYWGMNARAGAAYRYSVSAKLEGEGTVTLNLALVGADGKPLGKTATLKPADRWGRYTGTITASATDPKASLAVWLSAPGKVLLDEVSLFPVDTFMKRANGMRVDLAEKLKAMGPAFVRFPGGCFVEGDRMANATRWKTTIGPTWERPGHANLWGYRSTDGLGFHEYLQLCEDLGSEPLFVINCGMAHADVIPMDKLGEFLQDALDAIEYANGDEATRFGAMRIKNGHKASFNLRLMEIGNENGGPAYEERYAIFWKTIKARYPEMRLVANTPVRSAPMDIVDEHYYSSPEWFAGNSNKYDSYDRSGPRVYVGEYAVTQGCGQGNLVAAVAEAAFMTGMERNSDIVTMASYAPLFVNVNNRAWNPDAIVYDSARSFGTPSYHVQAMFARNRPDVVLSTALEGGSIRQRKLNGRVGVSTWDTQAEFKDIEVRSTDDVLWRATLTGAGHEWTNEAGEMDKLGAWAITGGALKQTSRDLGGRMVAGDATWTNYIFSLKARKLAGAEGFLIMFRVRDKGNWLWWNLGGWGNTRHGIEKCVAGGKSLLVAQDGGKIETGKWYDIRIELENDRIRCYLDNKLIHDVLDNGGAAPIAAVSGLDRRTGEVVVKIANTSADTQDATISLAGLKPGKVPMSATVLTSASPSDENTLDEPNRVAPRTTTGVETVPEFKRQIPPYSVTVLRLKVK